MTIRQHMNRKKRRFFLAAMACFFPMGLGMVIAAWSGNSSWLPWLFVPGLIGFISCVLYAHFHAFQCPRCRGPWSVLAMQTGMSQLAIDPRLRYCPYCGADIDAKDGATRKPELADLLA